MEKSNKQKLDEYINNRIRKILKEYTESDDITVEAELHFSRKDLEKAKEWGQHNKFTYERDEEWGDLLVAAMEGGIIKADRIHINDYRER
jgi:hypothetical protein